jgi:hypothetical protein
MLLNIVNFYRIALAWHQVLTVPVSMCWTNAVVTAQVLQNALCMTYQNNHSGIVNKRGVEERNAASQICIQYSGGSERETPRGAWQQSNGVSRDPGATHIAST